MKDTRKVLALVAHDSKEDDTVQLIEALPEHPEAMTGHHLAAKLLEEIAAEY